MPPDARRTKYTGRYGCLPGLGSTNINSLLYWLLRLLLLRFVRGKFYARGFKSGPLPFLNFFFRQCWAAIHDPAHKNPFDQKCPRHISSCRQVLYGRKQWSRLATLTGASRHDGVGHYVLACNVSDLQRAVVVQSGEEIAAPDMGVPIRRTLTYLCSAASAVIKLPDLI